MPKGEGLLDPSRIDRRWVRIRRPTIVVGGGLTLEHLEVTLNPTNGISEDPLRVRNYCQFPKCPLELTRQHLEFDVPNYFAIMQAVAI